MCQVEVLIGKVCDRLKADTPKEAREYAEANNERAKKVSKGYISTEVMLLKDAGGTLEAYCTTKYNNMSKKERGASASWFGHDCVQD